MNGIIIKAISSFYYVGVSSTVYECKARGNFRKTGVSPVVGDKVNISLSDSTHGVIEEIYERKNLLSRPLVSNIDKLIIVSSYKCPKPDTYLIDRLSAVAVYHNIEPIIVFNKCDEGDFSEFERIYKNSGFKTFVLSAKEKIGTDKLKAELKDCVCAFAGNSGVGKSSIINELFDNLCLKTGEVSQKMGRGRHTTRHTELFATDNGGYIADTPGFSSFDAEPESYDFKQNLVSAFPDIYKYSFNCKFTSCTHTCEKGCSVLEALADGEIQKSRHESYVSIFNELKDVKAWNEH